MVSRRERTTKRSAKDRRALGKGKRQFLDCQQRRDAGRQPLPASHDGLDPAYRRGRVRRLGQAAQVGLARGIGQLHRRAELDSQHVPVERGQIQQRQVERVPLDPVARDFCRSSSSFSAPGRPANSGGDALAGRALAERPLAAPLAQARRVPRWWRRPPASAALTSAAAAANASARPVTRTGTVRTSARRCAVCGVGRQPASPADVTERAAGGLERLLGSDALALEDRRDRGGRRGAQRDQPAPGPDRGVRSAADGAHSSQIVCGGGSSMALSKALAACSVARSASSNSDDPPAAVDRRCGCLQHQFPGLPHAVGQPVRADEQQVSVRSGGDLMAGRAFAAAADADTAAQPRTRAPRPTGRSQAVR